MLVKRAGRCDSLHLSKHNLGVTLDRVSASFFSHTDQFWHCSCPAGEVPQLEMEEKETNGIKIATTLLDLAGSFLSARAAPLGWKMLFSCWAAPSSCLPQPHRLQLLG